MEYIPSTYASILEEALRQPLTRGQGGHWEARPADVYRALPRLTASCASFIAAEIEKTLGADRTPDILRQAVRGLGRYRGEAIARRVEARGLPLDAPHLSAYWDLPTLGVDSPRENRIGLPHYTGHEVTNCQYHDIYEQVCPEHIALLICEEIHVAVAKGFNPGIDVWYPALLTRGQGKCIFRFTMTADEAEKAARRALHRGEEALERKVSDAVTSYQLLSRIAVLFYHFLADELLRKIGFEETEKILRRALNKCGTWRGKDMQQVHLDRGLDLSLENFVTYYDDPAAGDAWIAENVVLTPTEHRKTITRSAFSHWFEVLGTGRLAALFFEEALPAQAKAYNPRMALTIPHLMERGDSVSELSYTMKS